MNGHDWALIIDEAAGAIAGLTILFFVCLVLYKIFTRED